MTTQLDDFVNVARWAMWQLRDSQPASAETDAIYIKLVAALERAATEHYLLTSGVSHATF